MSVTVSTFISTFISTFEPANTVLQLESGGDEGMIGGKAKSSQPLFLLFLSSLKLFTK